MDPSAGLLAVLAVAGLLVGATGTWSPCGFSMIETIGPTGHTGGLRTTLAAAATFAPAAVLGGAITYGLLGWLGEVLLGAGGTLAYVVAALVAIAAAVAEARGTPIVPRVRRQLPIGWRSSVPMPLASAGYGVLLGLGFTTFVLSYGVWALMGVSLALGDPIAGLVIGIAFGVGRAVPIVVLAPLAERPSGERACEAMAMRPGLLRGARAGDAVALLAVAAVLIGGAGAAADASRHEANGASDPSVSGEVLAYEGGNGQAYVEQGGKRTELPGTDPAVGGPYAAVVRDGHVEVIERKSGEVRGSVVAAGADGVAISKRWIAIRRRDGRHDVLAVAALTKTGAPGKLRAFSTSPPNSQFSRPALSGSTLVYTYSKQARSSLMRARLREGGGGRAHRLRASRKLAFTGPSVAGARIAYVETSRRRQLVRLTRGGGRGHILMRRRSGPPTLWTTAISSDRVYVTVIARGGAASLISVKR